MRFNQLTAAEDERLALLLEQLGESIQIIGKIQRHGYESYSPDFPAPHGPSNRDRLVHELGDVLMAIDFLVSNDDIDYAELQDRVRVKSVKVWNWLHEQSSFSTKQGKLTSDFIEVE